MPTAQSRRTPTDNQLRNLFAKYPLVSNQAWASEWGVSKEWVRRLRKRLGFAPSSQIAAQVRADRRARKEADKIVAASRLSGLVCPVDGALVPASRQVTCSSKCAETYRATFTYRTNR